MRGIRVLPVFSGEFEVQEHQKKQNHAGVRKRRRALYKAKISMVTLDEELGREKKISEYMLFESESFDKLSHMIESSLQYMLIPFTVSGAAITNFDGFYDPEITIVEFPKTSQPLNPRYFLILIAIFIVLIV